MRENEGWYAVYLHLRESTFPVMTSQRVTGIKIHVKRKERDVIFKSLSQPQKGATLSEVSIYQLGPQDVPQDATQDSSVSEAARCLEHRRLEFFM